MAAGKRLARHQPCGCIVCVCEDEEQCQGCGARHCGTHPVGEIPHPVYEPEEPDYPELRADPEGRIKALVKAMEDRNWGLPPTPSVATVDLERLDLAVRKEFTPNEWEALHLHPELWENDAYELAVGLRAFVYGRKCLERSEHRVMEPASWWQRLKRDKAPKWFLRRWPVQERVSYVHVTEFSGHAWLPELSGCREPVMRVVTRRHAWNDPTEFIRNLEEDNPPGAKPDAFEVGADRVVER